MNHLKTTIVSVLLVLLAGLMLAGCPGKRMEGGMGHSEPMHSSESGY